MTVVRATSRAVVSDSTNVTGTITAANTTNVTRL